MKQGRDGTLRVRGSKGTEATALPEIGRHTRFKSLDLTGVAQRDAFSEVKRTPKSALTVRSRHTA